MKNKLVFIALGIMAVAFVYLRVKQMVTPPPQPPPPNLPLVKRENEGVVRVGSTTLKVEIADTDAQRTQGLSGRPPLPEGHGMLFLFDTPARHTFWMKEMKFSLDIIWIRAGRIVDISENVPSPVGDELPAVVQPKEPADTVLEVNADFVEKYGIKIGDQVIPQR